MSRRLVQHAIRVFQEEFWLFLLLAIGLALVFPDFGTRWLKPLALPAVLAQMYIVMLNIAPERLWAALKSWQVSLRSFAFLFLLTPLVMVPAHFFFGPEAILGLAVVAAMPPGMASTFFSVQFGGNAAVAVILTALGHLSVPVIAPILAETLAGAVLDVRPFDIFRTLLQLVVLPYLLAWGTRRLLGARRAEAMYGRISWLGGMLILIVVWGVVSGVREPSIPLLPLTLYILAANGLVFALAYLFGGAERTALSVSSGYRNVTLGMVLSLAVWDSPVVALPSIVWTLTQNIYSVLGLFIYRHRKRRGPPRGASAAP